MVFLSVLKTHTVEKDMRVYMLPIDVGTDHDLISGELFFSQFNSNFVSKFRCDLLIRREGLAQMVVHPAVSLMEVILGKHHVSKGGLSRAIDPGNKLSSFK